MLLRACLSLLLVTASCGGENSASRVKTPGSPETAKTSTLEAGAALLQNRPPVDQLNVYLDGFHFYSGNLQGQMEAHHYCAVVNEDFDQCVLFDGNGRDAKLMGVEYVVSRKLFETLPAEEKKLWHSHVYEVKSGELIAPAIPQIAEREFMEKMIGTYGKTWHTWHTDQKNDLPLGVPMLMMGFTSDGQLHQELVSDRDARFGVRTKEKRDLRANIPDPGADPAADSWQHGPAPQVTLGTAPSH